MRVRGLIPLLLLAIVPGSSASDLADAFEQVNPSVVVIETDD